MLKSRFEELQERNKNDNFQLCYELFTEEVQKIPKATFDSWFITWLSIFKNNDINSAIEYFKQNKIQ